MRLARRRVANVRVLSEMNQSLFSASVYDAKTPMRRATRSALASTSAVIRRPTCPIIRTHGGDAKTVPTYGENSAFFIGAAEASGRGAYAARSITAGERVLAGEFPMACHPTLANRGARCDRCLRVTKGGTRFCSAACEALAKREYDDVGVDSSELESYCEENGGGLKFPLLALRIAAMVSSGALDQRTVDWLCHAKNVTSRETMPAQWLRESEMVARAFEVKPSFITPEWYAGVTSRLHLNSFRVEIPSDADDEPNATVDFKDLISASLDASVRGRGSGTAVYKLPSLFNHSCDPSVHVTWEHGDATLVARAARDVSPGEELTITYIDADASTSTRRETLEQSYGFHCVCHRCLAEE